MPIRFSCSVLLTRSIFCCITEKRPTAAFMISRIPTARIGIAAASTSDSRALMLYASTNEMISIIGARSRIRSAIMKVSWTLLTSFVTRVISEACAEMVDVREREGLDFLEQAVAQVGAETHARPGVVEHVQDPEPDRRQRQQDHLQPGFAR